MFARKRITYSGFTDYSIIKKLVYVAIVFVVIAAIWAGYFFIKYISSADNINLKGSISYKSEPLPDVTVSVGTESTVSDENGVFVVSHLKFGSNTVKFEKEGYISQQEKVFLWHKNQQVAKVAMSRDDKYSLTYSGVVLNGFDKTPIKGAIVKLGSSNATTGDSGKFEFADMQNGSAKITISAIGFWDTSLDVVLGDGSPDSGEYNLTPYGRISFSSSRDGKKNVYTINYDGKNLKNLTSGIKGDCWGGRFTPDGKLVFFSNFESVLDKWGQAIPALYVLARGSDKPVKISRDIIPDGDFKISRNGDRMVFSGGERGSDKTEVYAVGLSKTNEWVQLTDNDLIESNVDISPDGNWVTYGSYVDGERDIFIQKVGDFDNKKISTSNNRETFILYSPDGKNILYVRETLASGSTVYLYSISDDKEKEIYKTSSNIKNLSWNNSGDKIVFTSTRDDKDDIYSIDSAGGNELKLTDQSADYENILWPNLEKILVFMIKKNDGNSLAVMDVSRRAIKEIEQISDDTLSWDSEVFDTNSKQGL